MAESTTSLGAQYAGLGLYVVGQAIIFVPLLWIADEFAGGNVIATAAISTLMLFGAITGYVLTTKANFSFLGGVLTVLSFLALGVIVCSILFGFELGVIFTVVMIALAAGFILYDTSNVLHVYQPGQHVAASLSLFASLALLFWYVLRLAIILSGRD
jgi:FtsH-binding integral membrane protein